MGKGTGAAKGCLNAKAVAVSGSCQLGELCHLRILRLLIIKSLLIQLWDLRILTTISQKIVPTFADPAGVRLWREILAAFRRPAAES